MIRDLRPDLPPERVARAVDALLLGAQESRDPTALWRAVRAITLDLNRPAAQDRGPARPLD